MFQVVVLDAPNALRGSVGTQYATEAGRHVDVPPKLAVVQHAVANDECGVDEGQDHQSPVDPSRSNPL